jgi:aspartate/methionine/tyrosine aminotransferase
MLNYRRSPIEIESPEQFGYGNIDCNLAESSVTDVPFKDLGLNLDDLVLAYGDHLGKPELREGIAAESAGPHPNDVLLTVGAAGALFIVATALLKPGDHVLVNFPNYVTNIETPRAIGCNVEAIPLTFEDGYRFDIDAIAARLTPHTRLVSLTCPHNPTGSMMTAADLYRLVELVEARGCYLLVDETYRDMSYGGALPLAAALSPRVISVSSLSKTYGLPGIRLGWLICRDPQLQTLFLAAKEQIFIANSVVDEEIAYRFLLHKTQHLERIRAHIRANLDIVKAWQAGQSAIEWVEPCGGAVCFPRIKPELDVNIDRFYRILNEQYKTFVGPGHWFEHDRRYMRIGFGWPRADELRRGLDNITRAVQASL